MARIVAIDFGEKRTGLAASDPMQIIANGITTVNTKKELFPFLKEYILNEDVETIVVGYPKTLQNKPAIVTQLITPFVDKLRNMYPKIDIVYYDERFTSKMAFQTMIDSGISKKARGNKALIDQISATIILQNYMESKRY